MSQSHFPSSLIYLYLLMLMLFIMTSLPCIWRLSAFLAPQHFHGLPFIYVMALSCIYFSSSLPLSKEVLQIEWMCCMIGRTWALKDIGTHNYKEGYAYLRSIKLIGLEILTKVRASSTTKVLEDALMVKLLPKMLRFGKERRWKAFSIFIYSDLKLTIS